MKSTGEVNEMSDTCTVYAVLYTSVDDGRVSKEGWEGNTHANNEMKGNETW